jgi:hypothetical protein
MKISRFGDLLEWGVPGLRGWVVWVWYASFVPLLGGAQRFYVLLELRLRLGDCFSTNRWF